MNCSAQRAQADVDPAVVGVPEGDVLEGVGVEVGAELAVEHVEDVLVELGGDPGGVVVGGLEPGPVLDQVGAEQEAVARVHQGRDPGEERAPRRGAEVADRAAEEGDQRALLARHPLEVGLVVADDAVDAQAPYSSTSSRGGPPGDLLGDVDRARRPRARRRRASRRAGTRVFAAEPEPSSIRVVGRGGGDDLVGASLEDRALGAGRVVLGQLGDRLEQLASRARRRSTSAAAP